MISLVSQSTDMVAETISFKKKKHILDSTLT